MAFPSRFNYHRPETLAETLKLMDEFESRAKVLAGGTDLIAGVRAEKFSLPENIIDISHLEELNFVKDEKDTISIGATAKLSEILCSPIVKRKAPILCEAISDMASPQIRNMGTIGGNLCNASPAADTAPPLLVLDAKAEVKSARQDKAVPIDEFFLGVGKTVVNPNEILTGIQIPTQPEGFKWSYIKLGRRKAYTLSILSVAVSARISGNAFEDARIALGAVAPTPLRITKAETFLKGETANKDVIDKAAQIVRHEVKPISDVRASAEYRREMSCTLTKKMLLNLANP